MKWSLLGIAAIFLLQIAFITKTYLDRPAETASIAAVPVASSPGVLDLYADDEPETASDATPSLVRSVKLPNRRPPERSFIIYSRPAAKVFRHAETIAASRKPVITKTRTEYPLSLPAEPATGKYVLSASVNSTREKRSFASKTVSIIKKPYDWLKGFASRLK